MICNSSILEQNRVYRNMASHELRKNNEKLIKHEEISSNLTQLQETLENCKNHRDDFQALTAKFSNEVTRKGKICSRCPEGWILHEEMCYFFSNEEMTWHDSKQYCSNQSSRLLSINNKKELDFITSLQCFHWIGLSRKDATSRLSWEDGTTYATDCRWIRASKRWIRTFKITSPCSSYDTHETEELYHQRRNHDFGECSQPVRALPPP
ncbi:hypothetical protein Y1Q_0017364 [Alligator mississippiensis]|uniref:Natural killer cells antigen CD94 n=1 Tax=Alligator mississippiensis TaxID=8496 RepID=A0A151NGU8_ALLMI|nr:hypothetical protein Y1Q_0017364 [Alligator mississippiensis]